MEQTTPKKLTGFAAMDRERVVELARKGGSRGNTGGFYRNPELASKAGMKGGSKSRRLPTCDCGECKKCYTREWRKEKNRRRELRMEADL